MAAPGAAGKKAREHASRSRETALPGHASILEEARRAGLLDGERSEHISVRVPPALLMAAKRESGITSTSELTVLALAALAQSDPVAEFFRKTEGRLGTDHELEF